MKQIILFTALAFTALGCSGKDPLNRESNPLGEYPGLENAVAPHDQKARTQYYVSDVFDISFEEQQESRRILNFVEGQSSQQKVRARIFMEGVRFDLKATNLPEGASFSKSEEEGVWILSWTPKFGFIPAKQNEKQWDIKIELVPSSQVRSGVAASLPSQIERTVDFSLVVRHTEAEPTIVSISGLEGEISESTPLKFKVQVADPASYSKTPPELYWGYDNTQYSKESKIYSGQNGIDYDYSNTKPKQLANGNWEYTLVYYPDVVAALHRSRAESGKVKVQFNLQAASTASEEISPAYSHHLNIVLEAPAPEEAAAQDQSGGPQ